VGQEPEVNIFLSVISRTSASTAGTSGIYAHEKDRQWDSLVLIFQKNCVVYSQNPAYDADAVAGFLKTQDIGMISGKAGLIPDSSTTSPTGVTGRQTLTKCARVLTEFDTPNDVSIRRLAPDERGNHRRPETGVDEFKDTLKDKETFAKVYVKISSVAHLPSEPSRTAHLYRQPVQPPEIRRAPCSSALPRTRTRAARGMPRLS
jgi:hypothetical protein